MPNNNPTSVNLDVRNSSSNGDGWTNVQAANGAAYSYKYVGGNQPDNNGKVVYGVGGGNAALTLGFVESADARYQFGNNAVSFQNDPAGQLSTHGNAPRTRVINDSCSGDLDATYKVNVTDSTANTTIPCDPVIQNKPAK